MHKKFYSRHWFLKNQIFSLFPLVKKMNANYAEICSVGYFETSSVCSIFLKFSRYCCETSIIQTEQRIEKNFLGQKFQKITLLLKLHRSDQFLIVNSILEYIFENKTQKQKI